MKAQNIRPFSFMVSREISFKNLWSFCFTRKFRNYEWASKGYKNVSNLKSLVRRVCEMTLRMKVPIEDHHPGLYSKLSIPGQLVVLKMRLCCRFLLVTLHTSFTHNINYPPPIPKNYLTTLGVFIKKYPVLSISNSI